MYSEVHQTIVCQIRPKGKISELVTQDRNTTTKVKVKKNKKNFFSQQRAKKSETDKLGNWKMKTNWYTWKRREVETKQKRL